MFAQLSPQEIRLRFVPRRQGARPVTVSPGLIPWVQSRATLTVNGYLFTVGLPEDYWRETRPTFSCNYATYRLYNLEFVDINSLQLQTRTYMHYNTVLGNIGAVT